MSTLLRKRSFFSKLQNELTHGFPRVETRIAKRVIARHDAIGVSFPKSGRTWLRKMLADLNVYLHFSHAGSELLEHGELPSDPNPEQMAGRKVLFVLRDPRDVLVSYHKDLTLRHKAFDGDLSELARMPGVGIDGIAQFNMSWINARCFQSLHVVHYEALHRDAAHELSEVCNFLGLHWVSKKRIAQIAGTSDFETMRKAEKSGKFARKYPAYWFEGARSDRHPKVRRGKVGGFADEMSPELIDYCNSRLAALNYPTEWLASDG